MATPRRPEIAARRPAAPIVAAVLGYGIYGIGGALYGCVLAVVALAIADQVWPGTDLLTPVTDPS